MSLTTPEAQERLDKLRALRTRTDLKLPLPPLMRKTFIDFAGRERPVVLRYYQIQGALHLRAIRRFVLGDDTGLGKTIQAITALCLLWQVAPTTQAMVLTTRSATGQWAREFAKFTEGVEVFVYRGTPTQRVKIREAYFAHKGPCVLVSGYRTLVQDFTAFQKWKDFVMVCDEATVCKNPSAQVSQVCRHMSMQASRVWGLTATLIKNNLIEGFGIIQGLIAPGHFQNGHGEGLSKNQFLQHFCVTRMQPLPGSNRQIPVVTGYTKEHIRMFKEIIDPIYLGRPKHEVATELPVLTSRRLELEMTPAQMEKYDEAVEGLLTLGDGTAKETTALTALIYCQQIVNHPGLLNLEGESPKIDALVDLVTEGDLAEDKVIVYTRFKGLVDLVVPALKAAKVKTVRITGDENDKQREKAMVSFQDAKSDVRVMCLTSAGTESLNLQAARAIICLDTPWSAGEFLQLLGRMIRIGSEHERVYVIHLVATNKKRGKASRTIDHEVLDVMAKKMELVEAVLGKRIKGENDTGLIDVASDNDLSDLFNAVRGGANK